MTVVSFSHKGEFTKTTKYFAHISDPDFFTKYLRLDHYGKIGVKALQSATPKDTGTTASSWSYGIVREKDNCEIYWTNSNVNDGVNIAVILQYGHGTRNGGYVKGIDYINPAIRPIFEEIAEKAWEEVKQV